MPATIAELAALIGGEIQGDSATTIHGAQSTADATAEDITFAVDEKNLRLLATSAAGAAVISSEMAGSDTAAALSIPLILVEDPFAAFCGVLQHFRPKRPRPDFGVSPRAFIDPTIRVGPGTNIYPGAHVGADVVIGANCDIHPGVSISAGCQIGDNCVLHPNSVLYEDVTLGNRVVIHANAVIGADGFGYKLKEGAFEKVPQLGSVSIEDDVEIGACTTIDRAMIGTTTIGRGTKLDNQVMIGHNCSIGPHNVYASQVGFAGSVTTGAYVICAGQAGIADHVHIGDGAKLASKAGVHKDLPGGQTYVGQPVQPERDGMKSIMAMQKLPQMVRRMRQVELRIEHIDELLTQLNNDEIPPLAKAG